MLVDLFATNYKAHCKFLLSTMNWPANYVYFQKGSQEVLYLTSYIKNVEILKQKVANKHATMKIRIENKRNRIAYLKALELAMDVLLTLDNRFVKGKYEEK